MKTEIASTNIHKKKHLSRIAFGIDIEEDIYIK